MHPHLRHGAATVVVAAALISSAPPLASAVGFRWDWQFGHAQTSRHALRTGALALCDDACDESLRKRYQRGQDVVPEPVSATGATLAELRWSWHPEVVA